MFKSIITTLTIIVALQNSAGAQKVATAGISLLGGGAVPGSPKYFSEEYKEGYGFGFAFDLGITDKIMLQARFNQFSFKGESLLSQFPVTEYSSLPYATTIKARSFMLNVKVIKDNENNYFLPYFCLGAGIVNLTGGEVANDEFIFKSELDDTTPGANMTAGFEFRIVDNITLILDGTYTAAFADRGTYHFFPILTGLKFVF